MAVNNLVLPEGQASSYHNLDEIATTTAQAWSKNGKFYDNIFKCIPLFWLLHEKRGKKTWYGGNPMMVNLQYGKNTTFGSISKYDLIDMTPQDNQTAAYFFVRQYAGSIVIDGFDVRANSNKYQIQDLLKTKISEAENTIRENINIQLWAGTPGAKDIQSLSNLIFRSPSSSDSAPGNISGDTYSWWRNQVKIDVDIDSWAELKHWMRNTYNNCCKGAANADKNKMTGSYPDIIMTNQETYEGYEAAVDSQKQYMDPLAQKAASMGFDSMKYKNALMFWDEMCYDAYTGAVYGSRAKGSMYFINTAFLDYYVGADCNLKVGKFLPAYNQDAIASKVLHDHCLVVTNRAKHGVLGYIDLTELQS